MATKPIISEMKEVEVQKVAEIPKSKVEEVKKEQVQVLKVNDIEELSDIDDDVWGVKKKQPAKQIVMPVEQPKPL